MILEVPLCLTSQKHASGLICFSELSLGVNVCVNVYSTAALTRIKRLLKMELC